MADVLYNDGGGGGSYGFLPGDQYDPSRVTKPSGEATPGGGIHPIAPDPFAAQRAAYDPNQAPAGPGSSTMPASFGGPLPPGQTPPPSYGAHTVYTDASGRGYDPTQLQQAMQNPSFMNDPLNARTRDIIQQYGAVLSPSGGGTGGGGGAAPGSPSNYQGTGVFSDPATSQYEQLLNGLIGRLNTNYTPQSWGSTMDALKSYIGQLNGPAYTNQQMDLFNTQAIDPIMAQRDADEQAIIRHFAAQGMGPDSGPVQAAIMANRQKYGAQADQARAQIASQGVNTQKQQQQAAMGYQLQIPTLETNLNSYNLGNAQQAAQYAGVIPNLAWSRLSGAQNSVGNGINPLSAMQLQSNLQQTGYNQGADYAQSLQSVLPYLLKLAGLA